MSESVSRPASIRTDTSNAFANNTMKVRLPVIIKEVQTLNPDYPPEIQDALTVLHDGVQNDGPIPMLDLPAPDYEAWAAAYAAHQGETWHHTVWFFAETFVYRHLIQAVRWWETERDPFAPKKLEELASSALWTTLSQALALRDQTGLSTEERLSAMLEFGLWGNRIDLSYAMAAAHGSAGSQDDLLIDQREQAVQCLLKSPGIVHIVNDNAGTELAIDMALADMLLDGTGRSGSEGVARRVIFHLKMHPTFVSDATVRDVLSFLDRLETGDNAARQLAERLRAALMAGRWRLAPDPFWTSSRYLWDMPPHLTATFQGAALAVIKGDANYRRMIGDALWPSETQFSDVVGYFPAPLLALRSLKSDSIVGLPDGMAARLDQVDKNWRMNGKRGLIQFSANSSEKDGTK